MVSIIIVNYNTDPLLHGCLASLSQHAEATREFEIVVINNGEPLPSGQIPGGGMSVRLVNNPQNTGYAAALNQGISLTEGPIVLCLNADTWLPPGSIQPLVRHLQMDTSIGLIAPQLRYPNGDLQYSCRRTYSLLSILARRLPAPPSEHLNQALRHHLMLDLDHDQILEPDWVQGSCLMVPREVLIRLGGFDERFFLYFEDYEICQRIRRSGLRLAYLPESKVVHHHARHSLDFWRREFWSHLASGLKYWTGFPGITQPHAAMLSKGVR